MLAVLGWICLGFGTLCGIAAYAIKPEIWKMEIEDGPLSERDKIVGGLILTTFSLDGLGIVLIAIG